MYATDFFKHSNKNNQPKDIANTLSGIALYSGKKEITLEPRIHKVNDAIWYDLGREAVKITKSGWEIVEEPPVLFRRYSHQKSQVRPVKGGSVQLFRKFTNIVDENDWNMFLAFAVATFIPDIPKPVLVINGSQGAGKSTPMRMLKDLADPSQLPSAGKITGEKELARLANRHSLLFFDNLSFLERDNSDVLCRLITGDGFSKRKLYSDDDEIIYNFKRPLMLNGINNFITQADLLDRAVILNVERIPEEKRLTELELWGKFEDEKPLILGGMLTILSKAMRLFPTTPTSGLPRMADFGRWGCAIFSSITNRPFGDFQTILLGNKERQIEESIDADPAALLAKYLANTLVCWRGTATDFLQARHAVQDSPDYIRCLDEHQYWPKDASQVGRRLRKAEGMLRESNVEISFVKENNNRYICLIDRNYANPESVEFANSGCFSGYTKEEVECRQAIANSKSEEFINKEKARYATLWEEHLLLERKKELEQARKEKFWRNR